MQGVEYLSTKFSRISNFMMITGRLIQ